MDLQLLNYIDMDMKWNILKKGRSGMTRRPRKLVEDCFNLANKFQELTSLDTKKFGVEKLVDAPLKKRRLLHQSPSPPKETPRLVSPGPQTPVINHEDVGQRCRSTSLSPSKKTKSKTRLRKTNIVKPKKNKVLKHGDFSGIELLAAAACSSFVNDNADRVDDLSVSKEETTPGIKSRNVAKKESIVLPEINASPVQDDIVSNGNEGVEKDVAPSTGLKFHWDLNTVTDEWEEPCDGFLIETHAQENCSKSVNSTLEGYGSRCTDAAVVEQKSMLDHNAAISAVPLITKTPISKISDGESSVGKSDVIDLLPNQVKCEDLSTSTTSGLREQNNVIGESDQQPISKKVMQDLCRSPKLCKSSSDQRVTSEDPLSECCGSNVTQDEQGLTTEGDSEEKLEVGYDSPFEDGELREPIENPFSEKDSAGTVDKTMSENVDDGQTMKDQRSMFVNETVPSNDIELGPREDTFKSPDLFERKDEKDESTSFDVQRTRSSNFGDSYSRYGRESGAEKSSARDIVMSQFHSRNYNPRGSAYRSQNRRHSPSERNNGYGSNRGPPVQNHSRDRYRGDYHDFKPSYFERKPHFPPKLNRPRSRSRSRSGSPIAWTFPKRKNSDTCNSGEIEPTPKGQVSPERSSKFTDDQNRDKRRSPGRMIQRNQRSQPIRYPERLKSDDHFRYTQHSARFSQMTGPGRDHRYKDNNDAIRKQDSYYEKVNRLGRHDDGFRWFRDNESFENRNRRNLDSFSKDPPKEQTLVTPPESRC